MLDFSQISNNNQILNKYIDFILSTYFINPTKSTNHYNFRCNVCGDSKKSKHKKRGYILLDRNPVLFYCHNCFYKKPINIWMKEYFPSIYNDYIRELINTTFAKKEIIIPKVNIKIKPVNIDIVKEKENTKYFKRIESGISDLFELAKKTCIDRKIPEHIWKNWYVSVGGVYKNRLIIPFVDDKGKRYYYQGRKLFPYMEPKYLSMAGGYNNIYNYYTVDKNKPVIILEGCIDSLFVENSIAMTGVKIKDEKLNVFEYKYFLIDYDRDTKETKKKVIELLNEGEYVFMWKKFISDYNLPDREKWDINDLCIYLNKDKFMFSELSKYFSKSIFDKVFVI